MHHRNVNPQIGASSEGLLTVGARVTVVPHALVEDLNMPVHVALLAEYLFAHGADDRRVHLDVEVDLLDVPIERTFLAEDTTTVRAHDPVHIMEPLHVSCQVRKLLIAFRTG